MPLSRCRTSSRCMYSVAPTSRPRVGCAAINAFGWREISRARMTFCALPPDRLEAAVFVEGVRMSKSETKRSALALMAPLFSQPRFVNGG